MQMIRTVGVVALVLACAVPAALSHEHDWEI